MVSSPGKPGGGWALSFSSTLCGAENMKINVKREHIRNNISCQQQWHHRIQIPGRRNEHCSPLLCETVNRVRQEITEQKSQEETTTHIQDVFDCNISWEDNRTLKNCLTLKVLNFSKFTYKWWISDSYCSLKPLWSGMGEAVPARTSATLHPPSPPTVL